MLGPRPIRFHGRAFSWSRRWTLRLVCSAAVLAALTFVAAANYVMVEARLVVWRGDVRLSWALLAAVGVGVLLGRAARPRRR